MIGVYPKDYSAATTTDLSVASPSEKLLAGATVDSNSITSPDAAGSRSLTADLYTPGNNFSSRWTADGDYYVYLILTGENPGNTKSYRKSTGNIHIKGATTVPAGSFSIHSP
ncbi:MAG: hypothetical protein LBF83_06115 [Spirochaetaceae bacterium]|jgi:hypothetical protein|nr:hypothetical protein [Spirochaetaceae bacterium]